MEVSSRVEYTSQIRFWSMTKSAISNNLKVDQNFNLARNHKLRNYQGKRAPTVGELFCLTRCFQSWRWALIVEIWKFKSSLWLSQSEFHHISNFMPNLMISEVYLAVATVINMAGKPLTVHLDTVSITLRYKFRNSASWTSSFMIFGFNLFSGHKVRNTVSGSVKKDNHGPWLQ